MTGWPAFWLIVLALCVGIPAFGVWSKRAETRHNRRRREEQTARDVRAAQVYRDAYNAAWEESDRRTREAMWAEADLALWDREMER